MIGKDKILNLLNSVIQKSKADLTEAVYIGGESGLTRFANSTIHQNVSERNSRVYFRVALGKKIGVASTNSFIQEDLEKSLSYALEIAKNQRENPDFPGLPPNRIIPGSTPISKKPPSFPPPRGRRGSKRSSIRPKLPTSPRPDLFPPVTRK